MAKQLINPVERHFEKGVLGVACMVLIGVIVQFLVTSPNQIDLGGQKVTPSTIDSRLAQKASTIQELIRNANVNVDIPEPLFPEFQATLSPLKKTILPSAVAIGPDIPQLEQAGSLVGQAKLVEVYRMEKPYLSSGRSTLKIMKNNDEFSFMTTNWATVSSLFDVKQQSELQRRAWGATSADVVFGPIEIQRRQRRANGSWPEEDWEFITPWPTYPLAPPPQITIIKSAGNESISRSDENDIEEYFDNLKKNINQLDLIRYYFEHIVVNGTEWSFPILPNVSYRDVLMQDDEWRYFNEPPATNPEDRYGLGIGQEKTETKVLSKTEEYENKLKEGRRLIDLSLKNHSVNDALRAYNIGTNIIRENPNPTLLNKATKLREEAEIAEQTARIWQQNNTGQAIVQNQGPVRVKLPTQQVWAHDALAGSIQSGETYQYRIRALIYNRLAGEPLKFANPDDAKVMFIPGPWSDPSDPITSPPDIEFFVTSSEIKRQEIGVEIYRWFQGVWVKSRRFKYKVGDQISGDTTVDLPSPDIIGESVKANADFDTLSTVLDLNFNRTTRDRKSGRNRNGVRFDTPTTETAVVYVDQGGNIHERIVLTEKDHPSKKAAKARVYVPK